jgi:hypothetical protein
VDFDPSRLRRGELIAGGGAVVLAVSLFLLPWYGLRSPLGPTAASLGASTSFDGWNGLSHLRWLVLVTILVALALVWLQATRRAPALPVSASVVLTVLGFLTVLALIYRVVINVPGSDSLVDRKVGAFVGLLAAIVMTYGSYASMREEGLPGRDARTEIETVSLGSSALREPAPDA